MCESSVQSVGVSGPQDLKIYVQREGKTGWAPVTIDRNIMVAFAKELIMHKLNIVDAADDVTLWKEGSGSPLDDRRTVGSQLGTWDSVVLKVVPLVHVESAPGAYELVRSPSFMLVHATYFISCEIILVIQLQSMIVFTESLFVLAALRSATYAVTGGASSSSAGGMLSDDAASLCARGFFNLFLRSTREEGKGLKLVPKVRV